MRETVSQGMLVSVEDDAALLAMALGEEGCKETQERLKVMGGPGNLLLRCPEELGTNLRIEPQRAVCLAAALELGRRGVSAKCSLRTRFRGGSDVRQYLEPHFAGRRKEQFYALYLDAKGGLLHEERLSEGTLTTSLVHPREVFAPAVLHRAAALVVAHNHPSGDAEVSAEDRSTTRRLQQVGRLLGIELLDHVVVGAGCYTSFLEEGWL